MIRSLLWLNGLAVLGAVINHASGWGFTSLFWWTDRYQPVEAVPNFAQLGGPAYYALRLLEQLIVFSVPAFLFVSGFFVAFAAGREALGLGWDKVGSRIKMLLIPYVLWSLVIFVGRGLDGEVDTPVGYIEKLLFGGAADPYYYVPLIVQIYLLSPFFVTWLKKNWKPVLFGAGMIQLGIQLSDYALILDWDAPAAAWVSSHAPGWFFPQMAFWFVFGTFAGFHLSTLKRWLAVWKPLLPWVTAAVGIMAFVEWELLFQYSGDVWLTPTPTVLDSLYSACFILTFMAFAQTKTPVPRQLNVLGEHSFGVYLIHAPVLELVSRFLYHVAPLALAHQFLFQILLIAAGIGIPLLLMKMVNRSPVRPYYSYLFG